MEYGVKEVMVSLFIKRGDKFTGTKYIICGVVVKLDENQIWYYLSLLIQKEWIVDHGIQVMQLYFQYYQINCSKSAQVTDKSHYFRNAFSET